MKLPQRNKAYIPKAKLSDYLLSLSHSVGWGKAKFFRQFGFNEDNTDSLAAELLSVARTEDVVEAKKTLHGIKYVIDGSIETPDGTIVNVRTVWIIETDEERPRFVTAHPHRK